MFTFTDRHIGPRNKDIKEMLGVLKLNSLEELAEQTVPENILLKNNLPLDKPTTESSYLSKLKAIASKNKPFRSLIGMGQYGTEVLAAVTRNIFENPSWYTSYTPYQAEISQGRLEGLLVYQTMISSLTGFPLSNSSMLDGAQAAAEAMRLLLEVRSRDAVKAGKNVFFVDNNIFPQIISVLKTRARGLGIELEFGDFKSYKFNEKCYGALVQYPAANGEVRDYSNFCELAKNNGALVAAYCDILSLATLKEPAAWGAVCAVGSTQRFGLPMGFGGPTSGYMATLDTYKRQLPGRIIGISVDRLGNKALRMALQTREQHIKRERATSNICTAQALNAVMSGMYAVYHGPEGLKSIAQRVSKYAHIVAKELENAGYKLATKDFFDTIEIIDVDADEIKKKSLAAGFNFFYPKERLKDAKNDTVRISFDELTDCEEAQKVAAIFGISNISQCSNCNEDSVSKFMARETPILTNKVFNSYHSETELMRYIKKLERKDISLTHSMIPLGSCTMKLNAAVEMLPLSWPELANAHPYAPKDQIQGSLQIAKELEKDLAIITGFDACSLQPNSGAAGEYAALKTIRRYFDANGQSNRDVILIPTSAHGTNPASAAMAGLKIVLINCDDEGNVIVDDLKQKTEENKENLFGLMITYPSTHGIFEYEIKKMMEIIHSAGGLVFMDGANMNGQVGLTSPGEIGADICHLNLHKSFAMPHGGGGPGAGPICCTKELAPYLPGHPLCEETGGKGMEAVSASPFGNALLNSITHAYIKLLGAEGLKKVTSVAILNANYMAEKFAPQYNTLYRGKKGRVGHECIIDCRHFKSEYGIDATDIAKRLMDFGFHAPTLSFPVHETLMVEPTESESIEEMNRFIEAMQVIKKECEMIKNGEYQKEDNPIVNAPHPQEEVCANEWKHSYSRETAAFPLDWVKENKFWPACSRVDNGLGDRNLIPTLED